MRVDTPLLPPPRPSIPTVGHGRPFQVVLSLLVNRYEFSLVNANAGEPNAWMIPTIPEHGTHVTTKRRRSGL